MAPIATCPGSTPACRSACYGRSGRYQLKSIQRKLAVNQALTRSPDFVEVMVDEILSKGVEILRVHVVGDMYNPDYAGKWLAVMKAVPGTRFYLYTRSWRKPAFAGVLAEMAALPNVRVWYSADKDSGVPRDAPKGVKIAYMQTDADDVPAQADLVFRTHSGRKTPAKTVPDASGKPVVVCPTETGLPGAKGVTCATCKLCWRDETPAAGRVPLAVV